MALLFAATAHAATYTANSCSSADVQTAINLTSNGDTVIVPAGTCTWTSGVSITKGITLTGSGTPNTGTGTVGAGTSTTIINDNAGSSNPLIEVTGISFSQTSIISLLDIEPNSSTTPLWSPISVAGTCTSSGCPNLRVDNVFFGKTTQWTEAGNGSNADWMIRADNVFGVLDHNTIPGGSNVELLNANLSAYLGVGGYGDNSWAQPDTFGTGSALYMENNSLYVTQAANDCDNNPSGGGIGGCRIVGRFNQITGANGMFSFLYVHGLDTDGRPQGGRQMEGYGNTINCAASGGCDYGMASFRSGTGFIFGNTLNSSGGGFYNSVAGIYVYRSVYANTPFGGCGGLNSLDPWDTNDNTVYYSGTVTSASGLTMTDTTKSWTTNQLAPSGAPYSVYDVTQGTGFIAEVASNTSNTITVQSPISESSWTGFNNGDSYQVIRSTVCADQAGRGAGNYISGSTPSPSSALSQALDSIYEWDDTASPVYHGNISTDTGRTIANRDWYTDGSNGTPNAQTSPTSPFNGTSGVGFGTLANRPTACTPNVGYFATDQGSWNSSGNGFGQGTFSTCTSSNTWTSSYTPYAYPHPLTISGPATYYVSTTGNDSNPGTSASPWLTPNHAVNCGDTMIASAGVYPTNPIYAMTVSNCPSSAGNYFVKYKCATPFACSITVGGAHTNGFEVAQSNVAIEGWVVNDTATGQNECFVAYPANGQIKYVMFDNDIAIGCNAGGFGSAENGTYGVDHFFAVGDIAFNAATGTSECTSGFDIFMPVASDSNAGTHYFLDGDFAYGNVNPSSCAGGTPTDGEGIIFDTLDGTSGGVAGPYCQQMVVENSLLLGNGGRGFQVYKNAASACQAPIYVKNVTSWGNNSTVSEQVAGNGEFLTQTAYNTQFSNDIGATNAATGAGGDPNYGAYVVYANSTDTFSTSDFWSATGTYTGTSTSGSNDGFTFGTNLNVNPNFASPSTPGSPNCGGYATTTACMATVIANFTPGNSSVTSYGYQPVGANNVDPLFPAELCNANLPSGLITLGCATTSSTVINIPTTIAQAGISRFGMNLSGPTYFGNQQTTANLIAGDNPSFEGQMYQFVSYCAGGSGTTWQDQNTSSPQPANFWQGASYKVIQGTSRGATGTVTASTAVSGGTGQIFTLSPAISACNSGNDDMLLLSFRNPGSSWVGQPTPGEYPFNSLGYSGSASSNYETTDISPSSTATQHLEMVAPGSATATVTFPFDAGYPYGTDVPDRNWINLNGSYTVGFSAKGLAGAPLVVLSVQHGGTTYETQAVSPTVNTTPGAGWQNYSYTFTASETGTEGNYAIYTLTVTGGTAILADAFLNEAQTAAGNNTILRDATYLKLKAWQPGVLRFMTTDTWSCTFDNMIASTESRQACGYSIYLDLAPNPADPIGFNDFLVIANAIGAAPWFTMSFASNPTDWANAVEFLAGSCGTTYGAKRCALGQTATWTSVFAAKGQNIYLEFGNEQWNSSAQGADMWAGNGTPYGYLAGANFASARTAPDWTSTIKLVASGWSAPNQNAAFGWGSNVLTAAATVTNGQADMMDGAAYLFSDLTQTSSNAAIFPPMWTEPVNQDSTPGTGLINLLASNSATYGVKGAIYEEGPGTSYGLNSITQTILDQAVDGVGAGLDEMVNALLILRDSGIAVQNIYNAFDQYNTNTFQTCSSTSGGCSTSGSIPQPLYANNWQTPGPEATYNVDRVQGIFYQGVNAAIGSNLNLLSTSQTGTPTYNQAAAQPAPNSYPTPGTPSIAANSAVPYIQAFAFCHGSGSCDGTGYTLIAFNFNLTASEPISFSGAAAPIGTVTKTVFTSTNVTDNNELTALNGTPAVLYPTSSTLTSPTTDTLPPFSMVTYTYGATESQVATPVLGLAGGSYIMPQSTAVSDSTAGATIYTCYSGSVITSCTGVSPAAVVYTGPSSQSGCPGSGSSLCVNISPVAAVTICTYGTAAGMTQSNTACNTYTTIPSGTATGDSIARTEPAFPATSTCHLYPATAWQFITNTVNLDPWNPTIAAPGTIASTGGTSYEPSSVPMGGSNVYTPAEADDTALQTYIDGMTAGACVEVTVGASGQDAIVENLSFQPQNSSGQGITLIVDGGVRIYRTRNLSDYNSGCYTLSTSGTTSCNKWITPTGPNANIMGYGILDGRGWSRFTTTAPCASGYSPCSPNTQRLLTLCTTHSDSWTGMTCAGAPAYQLSYGSNMLYYTGSSTTRLYKITLLGCSQFCLYWGNSANDFLGWGLKVEESGEISNSDGIDPTEGATNFSCYYCVDSVGDNNVAIKTSSGSGNGTESANITFYHLQTGSGIGATIGYNTQTSSGTGVNNVLYNYLIQNGGHAINSAQQVGHGINGASSEGGTVNLVTYENTCMTNETTSMLYSGGPGQMTNISDINDTILDGSATGNSGGFTLQGTSGATLGLTLTNVNANGGVTVSASNATVSGQNVSFSSSISGTGVTNSITNPGGNTPYPCTTSTWQPLIGEIWFSTASANNLKSLTVPSPATYTVNATMIPARAFPSTKESLFPNNTGTQGAPAATVEFTDNGSPVSGCTAVPLIHGDEFASCSLTGVAAGTHNYQVVYNVSGSDTNYPAGFTWGTVTAQVGSSGTLTLHGPVKFTGTVISQ